MSKPETTIFAFTEADHLTRIHLKLALEDVGFRVGEQAETIRIVADDRASADDETTSDAGLSPDHRTSE